MPLKPILLSRLACCLCALVIASSSSARAGDSDGAAYDWTGFYVGAQLGGLGNLSDVSDPRGPSLFGNPNIASGGFGGGQAGYNFQSGRIVYGFEAEVAAPDIEGTGTCLSLSGSFINSNCRLGIDAFGSLTARLGLALGADGRSLVYGKAGAAWYTGSFDAATNDSTLGQAGNAFTTRSGGLSSWGWTLGAGAEYAMTGNWSVKAEYSYSSFGNQSVPLPPSAFINGDGDVTEAVAGRNGRVSNDLHAFKVGVNYHFGRSGDDVDAVSPPAATADAGRAGNRFGFELGGRFWYSWGRHKYDLGLLKNEAAASYSLISRLTYDDMDASTGEVFGRVTAPWNLFAKGFIGGGSILNGRMNDEDFNISGTNVAQVPYTNTLSKVTGDIPTYGTIDAGYDWWRAPTFRFGTYVGYNYYRETMGAYGVIQTANQDGPFGPDEGGSLAANGHAIITQQATWQSLRVGAAGEFNLAPRVRLSWDAAFLPYVSVDAQDTHYFAKTSKVASINPLTGYGTGAQLEAMLSYDLTDQWSIGVGARYWSMWTSEGSFRRTYDADNPGPPSQARQHLKIETERIGFLGQILYRFD